MECEPPSPASAATASAEQSGSQNPLGPQQVLTEQAWPTGQPLSDVHGCAVSQENPLVQAPPPSAVVSQEQPDTTGSHAALFPQLDPAGQKAEHVRFTQAPSLHTEPQAPQLFSSVWKSPAQATPPLGVVQAAVPAGQRQRQCPFW